MAHSGFGSRDVGRGWKGVVGRLRHVDVVVGMHGHAVGGGDTRDHLVGVHVGTGARPGLEDVDRELLVVLTVGDFGGGGDDRVGLVRGQQPKVLIHLRAGGFQQTQRADLGGLEPSSGDRKVFHRALSLGAPQRFRGHLDLAHGVVLDAVFGVCHWEHSSLGSGYGSGYAALLSPVKSIAEYSLSLVSRWKPSTIRSVPDFERITIDWVVQPPGS